MFDTKAMLVELTIRQWTARKHDKTVSQEVDKGHGASNAGRYNKILIDKESLDPISKAGNALRTYHYSVTLPWGNNGQRLLPSSLFMDYRQEITTLRREFDRQVEIFLNKYPALVNEARTRLNTLYDPNDYPSLSSLRNAFGVDMEIFPVPTAGDFRVDVANEEKQALQKQVEEATAQRQTAATKECFTRIRDTLQRMKNQCVPGKTRITDSLVESVREITTVMDALNVAEDPELTRITQLMRDELLVDAETLRKSPTTRKVVGDRASEILESMIWS